jgi:hypothetical protein
LAKSKIGELWLKLIRTITKLASQKPNLIKNPLDVSMLVDPNCLNEYVHHDVQVDAYLNICFSNAKITFHFTKNVSYFVYFDITCNAIIHKYVKNHIKVYVTYIYGRMSCRWNEMMNGEKTIEHIIPNP